MVVETCPAEVIHKPSIRLEYKLFKAPPPHPKSLESVRDEVDAIDNLLSMVKTPEMINESTKEEVEKKVCNFCHAQVIIQLYYTFISNK